MESASAKIEKRTFPNMAKTLKYDQAKIRILNSISEENLHIGDKLPSERDMMRRYGISQISFRRAMDELAAEGLVARKPRSGCFLKIQLRDFAHKAHVLLIHIVDTTLKFDPSGFSVFPFQCELEKHGFGFKAMTAELPGGRVFEAAQEAAALLVTGKLTPEWMRFLRMLSPKPIAVIGTYPCNNSFPTVTVDHKKSAEKMVMEFASLGCRRISFINAVKDYFPSSLLHEGYISGLRKCGIKYDHSLELTPIRDGGRDQAGKFMKEHENELDAVVAERYVYPEILASKWVFGYKGKALIGMVDVSPEKLEDFVLVPGIRLATYEKSIPEASVEKIVCMMNDPSGKQRDTVLKPVIITVRKHGEYTHENKK